MIETVINIIDYFNLDRNLIGNIIIFLHAFTCILYIILLLMISNKFILYLMIIPLFYQTIFFLVFRGCIISKIEKKLTNDNYTVIDPILNVMNMEVTNKNRNNITLVIMIITWIVLLYKIKK